MLDFPNKKYSIIYADPPWVFTNYSDTWHQRRAESRWVGKQYSLMTPEEVAALPVSDISERDAVLFLWATMPKLPIALDTMKAWGFTYKTCAFTWVKTNKKSPTFFMGMGFWTRSNTEICLLGTRGKNLPRRSHSVPQVVASPIRKHSQKPDEVRERIVQLLGDIPRIELFARERVEGWDGWGNEY